jgi:hypothetical protein
VTSLLQVYGGSVAVVIGAQLWSSSSFGGLSTAIVKESNVSGLQLTLSHCSITGSVAATSIIGGANLHPFWSLVVAALMRV